MILLLAAMFLRERITPAFVLAVAGRVRRRRARRLRAGHRRERQAIGVALTLGGVVCCAVYYGRDEARSSPTPCETSQVVLTQQAYGLGAALVTLVVVIISGADPLPSSLSPIGLVSAITSGVLYFAGAYWLYLGALRRVTASAAAATFYLIPIVGVTAAALLLGERLRADPVGGRCRGTPLGDRDSWPERRPAPPRSPYRSTTVSVISRRAKCRSALLERHPARSASAASAAGPQRADDVDPGEGALLHLDARAGRTASRAVGEVRVVADQDGPFGAPASARIASTVIELERSGEAVVDRHPADALGDDLGRLLARGPSAS